jgi:hypothetical protein
MSESVSSAEQRRVTSGSVDTEGLRLEWSEAPSDTATYRYPVLQITTPASLTSVLFLRTRMGSAPTR